MIVIFILSTDSFSSAATTPLIAPFLLHPLAGLFAIDVKTISLVIRKLGHGSAYFILAVLLMRAVNARSAGIITKRHMMLSVAWSVIYALSDEWAKPQRQHRRCDNRLDRRCLWHFGMVSAKSAHEDDFTTTL